MKLRRKLPILPKKYSRELIYNKKYLKAEKKIHCICKRVLLIDSVHKKYEKNYLNVFLKNINKELENSFY